MALHFALEGLSPVVDGLIEDYLTQRAPQALLLSGAKGIGKEDLAIYLACVLMCRSNEKPCGTCSDCLRVKRGTHGNLLRLSLPPREKSVKIEALRKLIGTLSLHPLEEGRRVVIITDIDTLTMQAQSALLKSLEEPNEGTYFLISIKNEAAVLPTIVSRCRLLRLLSWPEDRVVDYLLTEGILPERAQELAALSRGLPGLALQLDRDEQYWAVRRLLEAHLFPLDGLSKIPDAALMLKDTKDSADLVLDIIEQEAQASLRRALLGPEGSVVHPWQEAEPEAIQRVTQAVFQARRYRNSNVSWQAILDRLLFTIAKEIYSCQWS
ncbi:MAG: hypothetical protein AB9880_03995 [Christensenellales bacterium]